MLFNREFVKRMRPAESQSACELVNAGLGASYKLAKYLILTSRDASIYVAKMVKFDQCQGI